MKKIILSILGAILGIPLSYFFMPAEIKEKVGNISGYIKHFKDIWELEDFRINVIISIVIFTLVGFTIGNFLDKKTNEKNI